MCQQGTSITQQRHHIYTRFKVINPLKLLENWGFLCLKTTWSGIAFAFFCPIHAELVLPEVIIVIIAADVCDVNPVWMSVVCNVKIPSQIPYPLSANTEVMRSFFLSIVMHIPVIWWFIILSSCIFVIMAAVVELHNRLYFGTKEIQEITGGPQVILVQCK